MVGLPGFIINLNKGITHAAMLMAVAQLPFIINFFYSMLKGKKVDDNPWRATTLEWQTPQTPPVHGNWGAELPIVYRWAYDYSVPGASEDFIPQNEPPGVHAASRGPV